ncbi:N-acetylmuramoyl-L-alanine amidase [bacterium]|nr:N-acetylmuramoyl-L-alanine amidase [bacterium]
MLRLPRPTARASGALIVALAFCAGVTGISIAPDYRRPMPPAPEYPPDFGTRLLVIDPGHGGDNQGAISFWFAREKRRNLRLARAVKRHLEEGGHWRVELTRDRDENLPNSDRPRMANDAGADIYISLHANGHVYPREGFGVIWYAAQKIDASRALAEAIAARLFAAGFFPDRTMGPRFTGPRGERSPEYALTHDSLPVYVRERTDHKMVYPARMPAVLIETHYMTHAGEAIRFALPAAAERLARALELGLADFALSGASGAAVESSAES